MLVLQSTQQVVAILGKVNVAGALISGHVLTRAKNSVALQRETCGRALQREQRAVVRLMWQEPR